MNYDDALNQAVCVLDDEFNGDFQVFDDTIAGEDSITFALQNWFAASGEKKAKFADDLEFAIRTIRSARTDKKSGDLANEIIVDSGTSKKDSSTGEWQ